MRPLRQRIMSVVARGVLESIDDGGGIQLVKASFLAGEVREDVERIQEYGLSSYPPAGSELVGVFVGGNREHGFIIACEPRGDRPSLSEGDVALHRGTTDHFLALRSGGKIEIKNSSAELLDLFNQLLLLLEAEPFIVNKATVIQIKALLATMKV